LKQWFKKDMTDVFKLLVNALKEIRVGQIDAEGNTLMHFAASRGNKNIIQILLSKNLSIKQKNFKKKRPTQLARDNGYDDVAGWMETEYHCLKIQPTLLPLQKEIEILKKENKELKEWKEKHSAALLWVEEQIIAAKQGKGAGVAPAPVKAPAQKPASSESSVEDFAGFFD